MIHHVWVRACVRASVRVRICKDAAFGVKRGVQSSNSNTWSLVRATWQSINSPHGRRASMVRKYLPNVRCYRMQSCRHQAESTGATSSQAVLTRRLYENRKVSSEEAVLHTGDGVHAVVDTPDCSSMSAHLWWRHHQCQQPAGQPARSSRSAQSQGSIPP